jgi:tripartite-type tricarboxylate transporter receptor subunit TctC
MRFAPGALCANHHRHMLLAAFMLAAALPASAPAQPYPLRGVRVIVPGPAGGNVDNVARPLAQRMGDATGQPWVVDNRTGAGGNLAVELAAKSAPDGYTILLSQSGPLVISPSLYRSVPYNAERDFVPIAMIARSALVLVVHPGVPAKNVKEFIALAKARPDQLNFASSGNGGAIHLAGEMFKLMAGVKMIHVPFKVTTQAVTSLIAGEVDLMFDGVTSAVPQIRAGRVRALGISSSERAPALPEVPTIAEAGVPGYDVVSWFGLFVPAGTPREAITKISTEFARIAATPEFRDMLVRQGATPTPPAGELLVNQMRDDTARWAKLIRAAGLKAE